MFSYTDMHVGQLFGHCCVFLSGLTKASAMPFDMHVHVVGARVHHAALRIYICKRLSCGI